MSLRTEPPQEEILELAKITLSHATAVLNTSTIPQGYLDELRKHVKFSKDDTLFRVIPQPGRGYGIVLCLEKGCDGMAIPLARRTTTVDDGKKEGIGSLSAYRLHVQAHPTHKKNRVARVQLEAGKGNVTDQPVINRSMPSTASPLMNKKVATSRSLSISAPIPHKSPYIKSEPSDSSVSSSSPGSSEIVSKKRKPYNSMDGEDTDITAPSSSPDRMPGVAKKVKVEGVKAEVYNEPLKSMDTNAPRPQYSGSNTSASSPRAIRRQILSINSEINVAKSTLANHMMKEKKSPLDVMRIAALERLLDELSAKTATCEAALQSAQEPRSRSQAPIVVKQAQYEMDIKPFNGQPIMPGPNAYSAAVPSAVASGSNAKIHAPFPGLDGLPGQLNSLDPILPKAGIPNYGDIDDPADDYDPHGRSRRYARHRGPIANPGDIEKFLVNAGNSELFDGNESVDKALEKIGLKKLGEQLPFMTISLMPHQVIGVAWMWERERSSNKGGILADEMGLGKTVQMIATMTLNRSDDPAVKSTLICAPVALLDQWKMEIETKTERGFKCLIYHGANKPKKMSEVQKYDVVLTTFQTLALEYDDPRLKEKRKNKKKKSKGNSSDDFIESDSGTEKKARTKGILLRTPWFRIILDEAQTIRNRNTRISIAVTNLDAIHRWCLTGTPVTNSLADCYGLIRFLEIRPWYDWDEFNGHIAKIERRNPNLATTRMQAILNSCLLRRKKDSLLDGKRLIELPPKTVVLQELEFSHEERDIYDAVEAKSQAKFNRYLRAGTVLKNYTQVLVLLLRLRQLCSHPCLIQEDGCAYFRPEDDVAVKHEVQTELDRATILAGEEFVARMKDKFKLDTLQRMAAEKESPEAAIEEECPVCFDSFTNPIVTRCGHVFCAECINTVLSLPAIEDGNEPRYAMSERPCPTCREPVQREMTFQRSAFEPTDGDLQNSSEPSPIIVDDDEDDEDGLPIDADVFPGTKKTQTNIPIPSERKVKGKARKKFSRSVLDSDEDYDDDDDMSDFIVETDEDEEEKDARRELKRKMGKNRRVVPDSEEDELPSPAVVAKKRGKAKKLERFLPSTKMKEMMAKLKNWAEMPESKNEKTMVLSQWTSCLDLVANYLDENGFTFVRYQGNMSRLERDKAVRTFMCQGKARVMLMSLKCGGVGLNLTRANRVISLDLGWSSAVESQAFDRVHRLGQTRPVTVQRLVIANTVEARILALQERKQNLADGSLGEGSGKKLGRLSVKDLANLFGLDTRGRVL